MVTRPFNRNVLVNNYVRGKHNLKVNFKQCISLVNHYLDSILSQNIHNTFNKLKSPIMKKLSPIRENRHFKRVNISPREKWKHKRNLKNNTNINPVIAENIM